MPDSPQQPSGLSRRPGATPGPPAGPAAQQRTLAALFLAMLSLAGLLGLNDLGRGIYVVLYALLAGVVALWLAITAMRRARRDRTSRPRGSVTATVIAGVGVVLSGVLLAAFTVLGKQLASYGQCLAGANTISSQQSCQSQFSRAVSREMSVLRAAGG